MTGPLEVFRTNSDGMREAIDTAPAGYEVMKDPNAFLGLPKSTDYAIDDPTRAGWSGNGLRAQGTGQTAYDLAEYRVRDGIDDGRFASVGYGAWHEIGVVSKQCTAEELLTQAGGMYPVFKAPAFAPVFAEGIVAPGTWDKATVIGWTEDPTKNHICRINPKTGKQEILGTVAPKYGIWQHTEMFLDFADALLDVAEPTVATAGILYGGRQAFMCWKLPDEIRVGGVDDTIQLWLLAHTSHDKSAPATLAVTPLRTVCGNTSRWNIRNAISRMTIRHTVNREEKVTEARDALGLINEYAAELEAETRALIAAEMTTRQFEAIVGDIWGPAEDAAPEVHTKWDITMGKILDIWGTDDRQEVGRNSAWAAVNTIGQFADWELKFGSKKWEGSETGGKFWRSLSDSPDVVSKKKLIMARASEFAGLSA